jgi:hypothetical protein
MAEEQKAQRKVTADVIETGAILLLDEKGKKRAQLACMSNDHCEDGYVVAHLYDGDGRPRITLQVSEEGASIQLWNRSNSPCVSLGVIQERGNGITICDAEGKPMIDLGASGSEASGPNKSDAEISVLNSFGEEVWSAP